MENVFDVADPPEEPGPEDVGPESLVPDCYRPGDWKSEQDLCACSGRGVLPLPTTKAELVGHRMPSDAEWDESARHQEYDEREKDLG